MSISLKEEALALSPAWLEVFRAIHQDPELGCRERRAAALIRRRLEALGIPCAPLADTGAVAVIRGACPGRVLGFRADMDALPIREDTGLP